MNLEQRIKMFKDVFDPKSGEKILFLYDIPHNDINDNQKWIDRRAMIKDWYETFKNMGETEGFSVDIKEFKATGMNNTPLPQEIIDDIKKVDLVIIMSEYSASSSLVPICRTKESTIRGVSMPMVEKRMEKTAFKADYSLVKKYALSVQKILDNAIGAEVLFSTGDHLYIDLRNRTPEADICECIKPGQCINFPSGESAKAPYEAVSDEIEEFGESKTEGIMPVDYDGEIVKFVIKNNKIVEIVGDGRKAEEMRSFFEENDTRKNIAELGIGCNPNAVVTGNVLEDEKVGLHIAYGMSTHIGGKVVSDMHEDVVYAKGCPIEGTTLTLFNKDGSKTELICDASLRYELLK